jgi:predicted nucleic acid-binding protein
MAEVFVTLRMMGIASDMSLVLDVSVAAKWFLRDEKDDAAGTLLARVASEGAYVPALFRWEIQSVLRDLPILVESTGERIFSGSELHLARHYDLTPYDAAYLALAAGRRLPLATFDAALGYAASDLGVIVVPSTSSVA